MQVNCFGEQHRHQQVSVQSLNNQVYGETAPEFRTQTKLEQRHPHHRNGHHKRADVRDQNRESDQYRQQQRIIQPEDHETNPGRHAHHNHLQHFAANVVGDLLVHLLPDLPGETTIAR